MKKVYEAFKQMLEKKPVADGRRETAPPCDPEKVLDSANMFLSHISLRHYLKDMTPDSLIGETVVISNPLSFCGGVREVEERCLKANEMMRGEYGEFPCVFGDPVKEYAAWSALFPEKREEMHASAFPAEEEDDEADDIEFSAAFRPASCICDMGDRLPLPTMIGVLKASMYAALMKCGEKVLAESLLS
jgi:hypothetical protein